MFIFRCLPDRPHQTSGPSSARRLQHATQATTSVDCMTPQCGVSAHFEGELLRPPRHPTPPQNKGAVHMACADEPRQCAWAWAETQAPFLRLCQLHLQPTPHLVSVSALMSYFCFRPVALRAVAAGPASSKRNGNGVCSKMYRGIARWSSMDMFRQIRSSAVRAVPQVVRALLLPPAEEAVIPPQ